MNEKAKEILTAAMGDEGDMIYCFEVNAYSGEIPQGNEAKRIELIRLALEPKCQTCGGSRKGIGGSGYENEKGEYVETETIPCPDCQPKPDACSDCLRYNKCDFDEHPHMRCKNYIPKPEDMPTGEWDEPKSEPSTSSGQTSGFVREEVVGALLNERVQKELALKDRIEQLEAEKAKLEKMLQDALPHIECRNDWQSGLISRIGEYFQTLKGDKDVDNETRR